MTERAPWFCPSCQKHHGPHVDTCPGGTGGIGVQPYMSPGPYVPSLPACPTTPWVPYEPGTCTTTVRPDTNVVTINGAYSIATGLQ